MKTWTILALVFAVCAVFLSVARTEESEDDFEEQALEDIHDAIEFNDQSEHALGLNSLSETPSDDEDETRLVKRMPWRRRRRRRRRRRIWRRVRKFLRKVCGWVKNSQRRIVRWACRLVNGDEEQLPKRISNDEAAFISPKEVAELMKKGWKKEGEGGNDSP